MPTTTINLTGQPLSKADDTNVTLTLSGTPLTSLLKPVTITAGWTGTLADARIASAATWNAKESALTFGTGLTRTVNAITIDGTVVTLTGAQALSNKTGLISQWTNDIGYLTSLAGAVTSVTGSGNIASSGGATPNITFTGVLPTANGGTGVNIANTSLTLGTASSAVGSIVLQNATNANTITIQSGVTTSSHTLTLPVANASGVLTNNGSGALTWAAAGSGIVVGTTTSDGTDGFMLYSLSSKVNQSKFYKAQQGAPYQTIFGYQAGNALSTSADNRATAFGYQALLIANTGWNSTAVGAHAGLSDNNSVGNNTYLGAYSGGSSNGQNNVFVGLHFGTGWTTGSYNTVVGTYANGSAAAASTLVLGAHATATASNQCVIGAAAASSGNGVYNNLYFNGVTHTSAAPIVINGCGGSGTNNAGASLTFATKSTGNATPPNIIFQTGATLASGSTLQTATTRFTIGELRLTATVPIKTMGYTVATLPTGSVGDIAYVTDATAPTYLGALVGGGAVVTPVFYDGSAWVSY